MGKRLEEVVEFVGDENNLKDQAREAVAWLYSKPEGKRMIREAYELHGKPIKIVSDYSVEQAAFFVTEDHEPVIMWSPKGIETSEIKTTDGGLAPFTLKRCMAHEFTHAAQRSVADQAIKYNEALAEAKETAHKAVDMVVPNMDMTNFEHRLHAAKGDYQKLNKIFGALYDQSVAPIAHLLVKQQKAFEDAAAKDLRVTEFVETYERPAIAFENLIATKYLGEPERVADYLDASDISKTAELAMNRQDWIDANVDSFHKAYEDARATSQSHAREGRII